MSEDVVPHTGAPGTHLVERCQICGGEDLKSILFMGYLPPVNHMPIIGSRPDEEASYPAEVLQCTSCQLVQLGLVVDQRILFPAHYPYRSAMTKILRDNFADLSDEVRREDGLGADDLVIDIGSNDGTLLGAFKDHARVHGIEPTDAALDARKAGVDTTQAYFTPEVAKEVRSRAGVAKVVTATNVFAHMDDIHSIVEGVKHLMADDGVFISESHYWHALVETVQVDTVYHEHLRYYALTPLVRLLDQHDLEVIRVKRIPTHGGSIRVVAAPRGTRPIDVSVVAMLDAERDASAADPHYEALTARVRDAKLGLHKLIADELAAGRTLYGIGAPSRASTLVHAFGLDHTLIEAVLEVPNSPKVGRRMPGTLIPVEDETRLYTDKTATALLLSWHIADELMPKLRQKGFEGPFLVPLATPRRVTDVGG